MGNETVFLVAGGKNHLLAQLLQPYDFWKNTRFIGIDGGALELLKLSSPLDIAIGDFDSIEKNEFDLIKMVAKKIITAPSEKDDTDTQMALAQAMKEYPNARVYILLGATGGRVDHFLSVLGMAVEKRFEEIVEKIELHDEKNVIRFLKAGNHTIGKLDNYSYVSFACLNKVEGLSIKKAKYELAKTDVENPYCYTSNEFVDSKPIEVSFSSGVVAVIQAKD